MNALNDKKVLILLSIYVFFLLFFGSKMSPFYASNEWADPNIYFNVSKGMLSGRTLYTEIFDHKGPFIFFIYALGALISSSTFFGMFLIEVASWIVLVYAVYYTARLYLKESGSMLVSLILSLFLMKIMKAGGSAEEFILVWESISLYFFIKYFRIEKPAFHKSSYMFIHGLCCAMTLFTKINLIMFWFFPLLAIFLTILLNKNFKNFIVNAFAFLGGVLVITLPIVFYLYYNNALEEAYNIYIELNRKYSQIHSIKETLLLLVSRIMFLFIDSTSLLVFPVIALIYFVPRFLKNKLGKWALILSCFISYATMFMAPMFQIYYPIPFLAFSVLGLIGLALFLKKNISIMLSVRSAFLILIIFIFTGLSLKLLFNTWVESTFFKNDKYLTQSLYDEIIKEKDPTLLNLGFGLGNCLFTTCNIVPNVKYFVKPNLSYRIYPQLRDEQTQYIRDKKTKFIIYPQFLYQGNVARGTKYIDVDKTDEFDYYHNLPILHSNYELILADTIKNRIDENNLEVWYLYKRRD